MQRHALRNEPVEAVAGAHPVPASRPAGDEPRPFGETRAGVGAAEVQPAALHLVGGVVPLDAEEDKHVRALVQTRAFDRDLVIGLWRRVCLLGLDLQPEPVGHDVVVGGVVHRRGDADAPEPVRKGGLSSEAEEVAAALSEGAAEGAHVFGPALGFLHDFEAEFAQEARVRMRSHRIDILFYSSAGKSVLLEVGAARVCTGPDKKIFTVPVEA